MIGNEFLESLGAEEDTTANADVRYRALPQILADLRCRDTEEVRCFIDRQQMIAFVTHDPMVRPFVIKVEVR